MDLAINSGTNLFKKLDNFSGKKKKDIQTQSFYNDLIRISFGKFTNWFTYQNKTPVINKISKNWSKKNIYDYLFLVKNKKLLENFKSGDFVENFIQNFSNISNFIRDSENLSFNLFNYLHRKKKYKKSK